jgi:hypothetical protein
MRADPLGFVTQGDQELDHLAVDLSLMIKFTADEVDVILVNNLIIQNPRFQLL